MTDENTAVAPAAEPDKVRHEASREAIAFAWVLRTLVLGTAVVHAVEGEMAYFLLCVAAIALLLTPAVLARSSRANMPVELEIIILWWVVGDMSLGRAGGLYDTSLWFDKFLHLGNSILLGSVAFLFVYVMQMTCCLSGPRWVRGWLIVLLTLGIGAGWEILEYLADLSFQRGAQGSPLMTPLDDTMWDLMLDGIGGVLGGVLGSLYMQSSRSLNRIRAFRNLTGRQCSHPATAESCRFCAA